MIEQAEGPTLQEQAAVAARAESAELVKLLKEAAVAQTALRKEVRKTNKRLLHTVPRYSRRMRTSLWKSGVSHSAD